MFTFVTQIMPAAQWEPKMETGCRYSFKQCHTQFTTDCLTPHYAAHEQQHIMAIKST